MTHNPLVSVVLPTFNRAYELPRSIASVLSQTYNHFELIVVDDASTDDTEAIVKAIDDRRVRYEKLAQNVGGAEARNVGIRMARGEIVAFQDSDDEWTCSKLERSVGELLSAPHVGGVFSASIRVWESGCRKLPPRGDSFQPECFYESLLWRNVVGTPTLVVKKQVLEESGGFDACMPRYQDWELALRLAKLAHFRYICDPLIISYVTDGSITQSKNAHRIALEKIYQKHAVEINEKSGLQAVWLHRLGDAKLRTGIRSGRRVLFEAFKAEPYNMRYFVKTLLALPGNEWFYNYATSIVRKMR